MSNSYLYGCFPSKSCTPLVRTGDTIIQYLLTPTSETGTSGNILSTGTIVSSYTTQKFPLNFVNVTISNLNNFVANLEIDISSLPIKNRVVFVALYTADNVYTPALPYIMPNGMLSTSVLVFTLNYVVPFSTASLYLVYY